ncbi:MAG: 50S ribosomal protein L21 [Pseudomonadota bacterium]
MYAVIKTGGKQYRVKQGDQLIVESLDAEAGETVRFDHVLMLGGESPAIGAPFVEGAAVTAEVIEQGRGPKIYNFKRRRRKHSSKRLKGHRQEQTTVRIVEILAKAGKSDAKPAIGTGTAARQAAFEARQSARQAAE